MTRKRPRKKSQFFGETDRTIHNELIRIGFKWLDARKLDISFGGQKVVRLYRRDDG